MAVCPQCNIELNTTQPVLGEIIICEGCGADLEVIAQDPLTFEVYEQEEK